MRNQLLTMVAAWKASPYTQLRAADHRGFGYDHLTQQIAAATNYTVSSGPYAGMKYFAPPGIPIVDPIPTTKLLGSFEEELHPWLESFPGRNFRQIVHIGSGEGYHVVGLARALPWSRTVVFDTLVAARKACRVLADQNKLRNRIQLRGFCSPEALLDVQLAGSLIFSDCGGAELVTLDPMLYPELSQATLVVETHDAFDPRVTPRLISRFSSTHKIEFVSAVPRDPSKYRHLDGLNPESARMALEEHRQLSRMNKPQAWALLTPYSC